MDGWKFPFAKSNHWAISSVLSSLTGGRSPTGDGKHVVCGLGEAPKAPKEPQAFPEKIEENCPPNSLFVLSMGH